jgi:hypothetical protein
MIYFGILLININSPGLLPRVPSVPAARKTGTLVVVRDKTKYYSYCIANIITHKNL